METFSDGLVVYSLCELIVHFTNLTRALWASNLGV